MAKYQTKARTFEEFIAIAEAVVYGGEEKKPEDDRMTVTAADKKANTKAWQNYKAGHSGYKAASHLNKEETEIDEAKIPVTRQAGDFRYPKKTGEEKANNKANRLSSSQNPADRRRGNKIRSVIKTVADRDTAQATSTAMRKLYKGQQKRANELAHELMNKEEHEIDEAKSDAGLSVAQKRQVRTARSGLTGAHADYERRGAHRTADERSKDLADIRKGKKKDSSHFSYLP